MIREAEPKDREQLSNLYRMLVPNSRKMNVLEEQIEKIRWAHQFFEREGYDGNVSKGFKKYL